MIFLHGHEIDAPGFTAETLRAAATRATAGGIELVPTQIPRTVAVKSGPMVYLTTRATCTCAAGQFGRPCKHRAWAIYTADVLGRDLSRPGLPERTDRAWLAQRVDAVAN